MIYHKRIKKSSYFVNRKRLRGLFNWTCPYSVGDMFSIVIEDGTPLYGIIAGICEDGFVVDWEDGSSSYEYRNKIEVLYN